MLTNLNMVNILQYVHVSHHLVYLKLIQCHLSVLFPKKLAKHFKNKEYLYFFKFNFKVDLLYIFVCVSRLKPLLIDVPYFTFFKEA